MGKSLVLSSEILTLTPILWVVAAAIAALFADLLLAGKRKTPLVFITLTGLALALYFMGELWSSAHEQVILGGSVAISRFGLSVGVGILIAAALSALSAGQYGKGSAVATGEFYGLILFATSGALVMVIANDLVTFFVALETMSISVYALTGLNRTHATSAEGAMKYFVLGAVASAFLLYGSGLIYAASGTLQLFPASGAGPLAVGLAQAGSIHSGPLALAGVSCLLVGLLFKVGAVPFHGWVADAYEGAAAPATAFMSVAVKAAALAAFLKIVIAVGKGTEGAAGLATTLSYIAMLSMLVGNFGALLQDNPKRLLAYSGIAHTGYALIAIVAVAKGLETGGRVEAGAVENACAALLFYLISYAFTNLCAFALLAGLERKGEDIERTEQLAGLAKREPLLAFGMLVAMISLAGVPLTSGFIAKLWVLKAALSADLLGLVLLGLVTSIVSLAYYLRFAIAMYMEEPTVAVEDTEPPRWTARFALVAALIGVLALGTVPGPIMTMMRDGARALLAAG